MVVQEFEASRGWVLKSMAYFPHRVHRILNTFVFGPP